MVHKSNIIPGLSQFIDSSILSHYAPTSMKRILAAGAIALYLNQNSNIVDNIINNPLFANLHVVDSDGMVNIELLRDIFKAEIAKAGFMRVNFPMLGDVDFTTEDLDKLYRILVSIDNPAPSQPLVHGINSI